MLAVTRVATIALLFTVPMVGCASKSTRTAATTEPSASATTRTLDVGALAGNWDGYMKSASGISSPVQVVVKPDGTYSAMMGASSGTGTFEVADGKVLTTGHLSGSAFGAGRKSTVTLGERGGRPVLVGEGRSDAGPYSYELMKRN